jgi:hypothetical protein
MRAQERRKGAQGKRGSGGDRRPLKASWRGGLGCGGGHAVGLVRGLACEIGEVGGCRVGPTTVPSGGNLI